MRDKLGTPATTVFSGEEIEALQIRSDQQPAPHSPPTLRACNRLRSTSTQKMRYGARDFSPAGIESIHGLLTICPPLSRCRLSRAVCVRLNWSRPNGQPKDMSCRVTLLKIQAAALLSFGAGAWKI